MKEANSVCVFLYTLNCRRIPSVAAFKDSFLSASLFTTPSGVSLIGKGGQRSIIELLLRAVHTIIRMKEDYYVYNYKQENSHHIHRRSPAKAVTLFHYYGNIGTNN